MSRSQVGRERDQREEEREHQPRRFRQYARQHDRCSKRERFGDQKGNRLARRHHWSRTHQQPHDVRAELVVDVSARDQAGADRAHRGKAKGSTEFS